LGNRAEAIEYMRRNLKNSKTNAAKKLRMDRRSFCERLTGDWQLEA